MYPRGRSRQKYYWRLEPVSALAHRRGKRVHPGKNRVLKRWVPYLNVQG